MLFAGIGSGLVILNNLGSMVCYYYCYQRNRSCHMVDTMENNPSLSSSWPLQIVRVVFHLVCFRIVWPVTRVV